MISLKYDLNYNFQHVKHYLKYFLNVVDVFGSQKFNIFEIILQLEILQLKPRLEFG